MTPLEWLHLTVLIAGPSSQISDLAMRDMLAIAQQSALNAPPITVELSKIIYHPEAIVLAAEPADSLNPILEAAKKATQAVTGHDGTIGRSSSKWTPHVTLAYSTSTQPAEPIIAALGKESVACNVTIDAFSLVIQQGSEWLWKWSPVGTVSLAGSLGLRFSGCTPISR